MWFSHVQTVLAFSVELYEMVIGQNHFLFNDWTSNLIYKTVFSDCFKDVYLLPYILIYGAMT